MVYVRYVIAIGLILLSSIASANNVGDFAENVAGLSKQFDFSVTSWIRSPARNERVGGVKHSQHMQGLAVDVVLDNKNDKKKFIEAIKKLGYYFKDEGDHIHIGWRNHDGNTTRTDNPTRINTDRRGDEAVGDEAAGQSGAKQSIIRKSKAPKRSSERCPYIPERRISMDSTDDSIDSYFRSHSTPEVSSTVHRYNSHRGVDTIRAWVPLFNRREERPKLVRYEGFGNHSPRHPLDECYNWFVFWWKHCWEWK